MPNLKRERAVHSEFQKVFPFTAWGGAPGGEPPG